MEHERFWIDSVRSDNIGIRLQEPLSFAETSANVETYKIPGRNGALHTWDGSYANIKGKARCFAIEKHDVERALWAVNKWAFLEPGYHRLETTEEPDIYRMAFVKSGPETEIRMRTLSPFTITFDCMPQRFLKSGERRIRLNSGSVLKNEWFNALPVFEISGTGAGKLTIGDVSIDMLDTFSGDLIFDCETHNAYFGDENLNSHVYAPDTVSIPNGKTEITWSGGIKSVNVIPRWWML